MKKIILAATTVLTAIFLVGCTRTSTQTDTSGGKPWIDSAIQANVKKTKKPAPQDDFHLHVNHDWLLKAKIPEGEPRYGSFSEAAKEIDDKVLSILNDNTVPGNDAEQVHALYHAFLDWDARNAAGTTPVLPIIQDIRAIKTIDDLSDFICDPERSFWTPTLVSIGNEASFDDASSYATCISTDSLTLDDAAEYQNRTETGNRYAKGIFHIFEATAVRLGYSKKEAQDVFDTTLGFEGKIAAKSLTQADEMSPDYIQKINNSYTPQEVAKLLTKFPLVRYIESQGYANAKKFIIFEPEALKMVDELYTQENLESIKAYMLMHSIHLLSSYLDQKADKICTEANNILSGATGNLSDEKRAANMVRGMLPVPMARAYLARYDMSEMKKKITEICRNVIATYREMLKGEDWLSEETRAKAIEKLDAITIHAVYPEKWIDFSSLNLKGLSYMDATKAVANFARNINRSHTNGKVDTELWSIQDILQTNAFYNPQDNSINMILGLLANPFYYEGMSQEALLGSIGAVIGHEISHAFDTNGAQFDKDGNFANWWTEQDYKAFQNRAAKLIAYYDGVTPWKGMEIQGKKIQTEAIADMAGIKAILLIAKKMPNFDYKAFFEAYAGNWRMINTIEYEQNRIKADPHPLNYLRTNVSLQQYDEFMETFNVHEGDNMYLAPKDRILVW
ncbi:MAG: M13 family metallopeptidase [Treponema sp.]|nr:M13 family metallopeptidase [Treponema sp.]